MSTLNTEENTEELLNNILQPLKELLTIEEKSEEDQNKIFEKSLESLKFAKD